MENIKLSVIIATYNMPEWLEKVLWGYSCQTYKDFEIVIADDGSGPETKKVIEKVQAATGLDIKHLWHEDKGYRRQTILNKAILEAKYDYLLFTDGDCIPRNDFVEIHAKHAEEGYFLSGGYCKLPLDLSKAITKEDILEGRSFNVDWLKEKGLNGRSQLRKLSAKGFWVWFYNSFTTAKATFNNCNTSVWKADAIAVNGYDERMQYGGSDREIGERLFNLGIKSKQIRYSAICLHLDHSRGYKTPESMKKNIEIRKVTRRHKIKFTPAGIIKEKEN